MKSLDSALQPSNINLAAKIIIINIIVNIIIKIITITNNILIEMKRLDSGLQSSDIRLAAWLFQPPVFPHSNYAGLIILFIIIIIIIFM